jgi:hypothetical protein
VNWPRVIANFVVSGLLLPTASLFALLEWSTVDRSQCNWETFENICSDYEGMYGMACGVVLLIWATLTWAINRKRKESY